MSYYHRWLAWCWRRLHWLLWLTLCFAFGWSTIPSLTHEMRDPWPAATKPAYYLRWEGWDASGQWAMFSLTVTNESTSQQLTVPTVYDGMFGPDDFRSRNFRTLIMMELARDGAKETVYGQRGPRLNYLLDYGTLITLPPGGSLTGRVRIRTAITSECTGREHEVLIPCSNCVYATVYVNQVMTTPAMTHSHSAEHVWQGDYRTEPTLVPAFTRQKGKQ